LLKRLADALNTTTDYLMDGNTDEAASEKIRDKELLNLFKEVEKLDNKDKNMIKTFLDALVTKRHIQHLAL